LEALEDRLAPAVDLWQGASGGLWSVGSNWSLGAAPGSGDIATFDPSLTGGANTSSIIDSVFAGSVDGVNIASGYTQTITENRNLTVGASGFTQAGGTFDINGTTLTTAGLSGTGSITNSADVDAALTVNNATANTYAGTISGHLALTKGGAGRLELTGNNTFFGNITINAGTLAINKEASLGNVANSVTINAATLEAEANVVSNRTYTANSFSSAIQVDSNIGLSGVPFFFDITGTIVGSGSLTKLGTGVLILDGSNQIFGLTTVSAGILEVNSTLPSHISVNGGATLAGTGTVGGIDAFAQGTVSPGTFRFNAAQPNSPPVLVPGQLTQSGDDIVNFQAGSIFTVLLNGTTAGSQYSRLVYQFEAFLGDATLNASAGFQASSGTTFTIIQPSSSQGAFIGPMFSGLPDGTVFNISGQLFRINYTSNSVILTRVTGPNDTIQVTAAPTDIFDRPITITAKVIPSVPTSVAPAGTMTFLEGTTVLGSAQVINGVATFTSTTVLPACMSYTITAQYSGDPAFQANSGSTTIQVVYSPNQAYVVGLYRDVVERTFDLTGFRNWVSQLDGGTARDVVATGFLLSPEHRRREVDHLYVVILHRNADAGGEGAWSNALMNGMTESEVAILFFLSPEYQSSHLDDVSFIKGLYFDVFGRVPSAAEVAGWFALLQRGLRSRGDVAFLFLSSGESYLLAINQDYQTYVDRNPDPAGQQNWVVQLSTGALNPITFALQFLMSGEYFILQQTKSCMP
jgi:autotransporter-associated beta strand protein